MMYTSVLLRLHFDPMGIESNVGFSAAQLRPQGQLQVDILSMCSQLLDDMLQEKALREEGRNHTILTERGQRSHRVGRQLLPKSQPMSRVYRLNRYRVAILWILRDMERPFSAATSSFAICIPQVHRRF